MQDINKKNGILEFDGKKYAVGLTWLTTQEEPDPKLLKQRAAAIKADFFALRETISFQQGFGSLEMGHRRNMPAAAASAADVMVGEWHGVFTADNGWWYVAVHSDAIAPDGDILFETEEEAYNYFVERNEGYKWPRAFAPEEWNLPDITGEVTLDKVFDEISLTNLTALNIDGMVGGKRNKKILVLFGVIVLGALATLISLQSFLPSILPERAQPAVPRIQTGARIAAPPKAREGLGTDQPELVEEQPGIVLNMPKPSGVLKVCVETIDLIAVPIPSWRLDRVVCDGVTVSGFWVRSSAAAGLQSIQRYLNKFPKATKHNYNGDDAYQAIIPADIDVLFPVNMVLIERDQAIVRLNKRFSGLGALEVDYEPPSRAIRAARGSRNQPVPVSGKLRMSLTTSAPPTVIANYFDIAGLQIDEVTWLVEKAKWVYKATVTLKAL